MILYIIRGLPGSGKSTYAKKLNCFHIEADMYHYINNLYAYNAKNNKAAHNWCISTAKDAMYQGMDIAVSNTFTQKWEIQPYIDIANRIGYTIKIICMNMKFNTIHDVPINILDNMKKRWEKIEGEIYINNN